MDNDDNVRAAFAPGGAYEVAEVERRANDVMIVAPAAGAGGAGAGAGAGAAEAEVEDDEPVFHGSPPMCPSTMFPEVLERGNWWPEGAAGFPRCSAVLCQRIPVALLDVIDGTVDAPLGKFGTSPAACYVEQLTAWFTWVVTTMFRRADKPLSRDRHVRAYIEWVPASMGSVGPAHALRAAEHLRRTLPPTGSPTPEDLSIILRTPGVTILENRLWLFVEAGINGSGGAADDDAHPSHPGPALFGLAREEARRIRREMRTKPWEGEPLGLRRDDKGRKGSSIFHTLAAQAWSNLMELAAGGARFGGTGVLSEAALVGATNDLGDPKFIWSPSRAFGQLAHELETSGLALMYPEQGNWNTGYARGAAGYAWPRPECVCAVDAVRLTTASFWRKQQPYVSLYKKAAAHLLAVGQSGEHALNRQALAVHGGVGLAREAAPGEIRAYRSDLHALRKGHLAMDAELMAAHGGRVPPAAEVRGLERVKLSAYIAQCMMPSPGLSEAGRAIMQWWGHEGYWQIPSRLANIRVQDARYSSLGNAIALLWTNLRVNCRVALRNVANLATILIGLGDASRHLDSGLHLMFLLGGPKEGGKSFMLAVLEILSIPDSVENSAYDSQRSADVDRNACDTISLRDEAQTTGAGKNDPGIAEARRVFKIQSTRPERTVAVLMHDKDGDRKRVKITSRREAVEVWATNFPGDVDPTTLSRFYPVHLDTLTAWATEAGVSLATEQAGDADLTLGDRAVQQTFVTLCHLRQATVYMVEKLIMVGALPDVTLEATTVIVNEIKRVRARVTSEGIVPQQERDTERVRAFARQLVHLNWFFTLYVLPGAPFYDQAFSPRHAPVIAPYLRDSEEIAWMAVSAFRHAFVNSFEEPVRAALRQIHIDRVAHGGGDWRGHFADPESSADCLGYLGTKDHPFEGTTYIEAPPPKAAQWEYACLGVGMDRLCDDVAAAVLSGMGVAIPPGDIRAVLDKWAGKRVRTPPYEWRPDRGQVFRAGERVDVFTLHIVMQNAPPRSGLKSGGGGGKPHRMVYVLSNTLYGSGLLATDPNSRTVNWNRICEHNALRETVAAAGHRHTGEGRSVALMVPDETNPYVPSLVPLVANPDRSMIVVNTNATGTYDRDFVTGPLEQLSQARTGLRRAHLNIPLDDFVTRRHFQKMAMDPTPDEVEECRPERVDEKLRQTPAYRQRVHARTAFVNETDDEELPPATDFFSNE